MTDQEVDDISKEVAHWIIWARDHLPGIGRAWSDFRRNKVFSNSHIIWFQAEKINELCREVDEWKGKASEAEKKLERLLMNLKWSHPAVYK